MKKIISFIIFSFTGILIVNAAPCFHISGDGTKIGDEIACGTEHFYVISNDGENIRMISKYNLLVGRSIYRVDLNEKYTNSQDVYLDENVQEKMKEGYYLSYSLSEYIPETDEEMYYASVLYKPHINDEDYQVIFFDEKKNIEDALRNKEAKEYLNNGYMYNLVSTSDSKYIGVTFYKEENKEYKVVILDENHTSKHDMLKSEKIKAVIDENYRFSHEIKTTNNEYIGAVFYKKDYYKYKTVITDNAISDYEDLRNDSKVKEAYNEGYKLDWDSISYSGKYIGANLYKENSSEYRTIMMDKNYSISELTLYNNNEIKTLLEDGYYITERVKDDSYCFWREQGYCRYQYARIVLRKNANYSDINIFFEKQIHSNDIDNYINTNSEIQQKIAEGYKVYKDYSITRYDTNSKTFYTTYSGVRLSKYIGEKEEEEKEEYLEVFQHESAIGAHDGETGMPAPDENGVIYDTEIEGSFNEEFLTYSDGYRDFIISDDIAQYYLSSYQNTLNENGFDILDINIITVSEINDLVKKVTGSEIPLEDWYYDGVGWSEDPVTGDEFYILGSIKEIMPEEYSWLWGTTYWTRTADPNWSNTYFIDTLGDLCAAEYCKGTIGAGLRPVVTIAADDVVYKIETKTDGNGEVKADYVEAKGGTVVKFTVTPKEGYVLGEVKVTDKNGNVVIFTDYTFTMPNADVLIEATFVPENPNTVDKISLLIITIFALGLVIIHNNKKRISLN